MAGGTALWLDHGHVESVSFTISLPSGDPKGMDLSCRFRFLSYVNPYVFTIIFQKIIFQSNYYVMKFKAAK